jgi:hypothetical protein
VIVDRGRGESRHAEHQGAEHDAIAKYRFHRLLLPFTAEILNPVTAKSRIVEKSP